MEYESFNFTVAGGHDSWFSVSIDVNNSPVDDA